MQKFRFVKEGYNSEEISDNRDMVLRDMYM